MGVPKFFRYISERYPCLSEIVKEYQIPEFDNLYLDMNGIIHTCSHPDDGDPHFRITEEKIFKDIFHYIEVLFRMIKPQKLFFMAVDGVAPRAKMNQQRGRRFRSAKDALDLEERARAKGEELPTEARFDSNCITPGTEFMARLHDQLKYFITYKISTDPLWQKCKVVLSGHETPGEGEHKIMDYIRYLRSQPGYDPNTRHCLYGLDADLIMLGLCTHEPHFSLLREEVKFGKKSTKRKSIPEQMTFFLLHLSLMREYLELEFLPLKENLPFPYDFEHIIDDWVLMGFLVGNDFIPHLPNMHIANGALPVLYKAYMKVLPTLGGYINESGTLNLERFEKFLRELSEIDIENFSDQYADLKWFEGKTGRKFSEKAKTTNVDPWKDEEYNVEKGIAEDDGSVDNWEERLEDSVTSDSDDDLFLAEFKQHKTDYYMNKLEYEQVTPEVLKSQAEGYVRAIQWNLHYYYNGVCSWSWYYPHHYAPYISDIRGFKDLKLEFDLGKPFQPFEQLLAVLPAASKQLLPEAYQDLMTNELSPIKDYYPETFKTDLNGKKQEWEAVVLIPFIDEANLLEAMRACNEKLTEEERRRNTHGPMLIYQYTLDDLGTYEAPSYFPPVPASHAYCEKKSVEEIRVPIDKLVKGAYPGVKMDVYYPGFPTMKHLEYTATLEKAKVKVFEQPSRNESMIVKVKQREMSNLDDWARKMLGEVVFVSWPHLIEAHVVSISNRQYIYHCTGVKGQYNVEEAKGHLAEQWRAQVRGITEHYKTRMGIDVGDTEVLVHVKVMVGRKYVFTPQGRVNLEKQWSEKVESVYPLQTVVQNIAVYDKKYTMYKDIGSVFPTGCQCFMLGQPYYGAVGEVLEGKETLKNGRVKVNMRKTEEPDLAEVKQLAYEISTQYMPLQAAATKLSISRNLFSRVTGSIFIILGGRSRSMELTEVSKVNVGLNLKFNKKNEEIPGYTRRDGSMWMYSEKAVGLVESYLQLCPQLIEYLNQNGNCEDYYEEDIFPEGDGKEKLKEITTWIKKQPFYSVERQVCGSLTLEEDVVKKLEQIVDEFNKNNSKVKKVMMQVKPHLLYRVGLQIGNLMPDASTTFQLYDRVVNVRESYTVPVGLKGTIIAIHKPQSSKEEETVYDVVFDHEFPGGLQLNCSPNRGYRLPKPAMINISHGTRLLNQKTGNRGHLVQSLHGEPQNITKSSHSLNGPLPHSSNNFYPHTPFVPYNFPNTQPLPNLNNFRPPNFNGGPPVFGGHNQRPVYNLNASNSVPFNLHENKSHPPFGNGKNAVVHAPQSAMSSGPLHSFHGGAFNNIGSNSGNNGTNNARINQLSTNQGFNLNVRPRSQGGFPLVPPPHVQNCQNSFMPGYAGGSRNRQNQDQRGKGDNAAQKVHSVSVSSTSNRPAILKQEPVPNTKREPPPPPIPKVDTDLLKKMLKINENICVSESRERRQTNDAKKEKSTSLTVEDIFAHARSKEQEGKSKDAFYTARLLSHYQSLGLGCPRYQYFELAGGKFQAQITLHNGTTVTGGIADSKENASEYAAAEALKHLDGQSNSIQINKPHSSKGSHKSDGTYKLTKSSHRDKYEIVQGKMHNLQIERKELRRPNAYTGDSNFKQNDSKKKLLRNENRESCEPAGKSAPPNSDQNKEASVHSKQNLSAFINSPPFIPLQVIRHRTKSLSSSSNSNAVTTTTTTSEETTNSITEKQKKESEDKKEEAESSSASSVQKQEEHSKKPNDKKEVEVKDSGTMGKDPSSSKGKPVHRRRERKMRIAANFQAARVQ